MRYEDLGKKVSVYWVRTTSTRELATGKTRRYRGKHRFKMYISNGTDYFETKYVGLGTFLKYNKRTLLLPSVGLGLAFLTSGIWLQYATSALRVLVRLSGLDWPT